MKAALFQNATHEIDNEEFLAHSTIIDYSVWMTWSYWYELLFWLCVRQENDTFQHIN